MPTAAEIIAQLNALPDAERADAVTLLANDGGPVVTAARSKAFAAGKKEGEKAAATPTAELATARERLADVEAELADVKAKAPDAAAIEQRVRGQLEPKLAAALKQANDERALRLGKDVDLTFGAALAALREKADDGTSLKPSWEPVVRARFADRVRPNDDGTLRVLQLGSELAYDAPDATAAAKLLAADVRREMARTDPDSIASSAQGGGGQGGGGGYRGQAPAREAIQQDLRARGVAPSI